MKTVFISILLALFSIPLLGQNYWMELRPFNVAYVENPAGEGLIVKSQEGLLEQYTPSTGLWTAIASEGVPYNRLYSGLDGRLYSYAKGLSVLVNSKWVQLFEQDGEDIRAFSVSRSGKHSLWITNKGIYVYSEYLNTPWIKVRDLDLGAGEVKAQFDQQGSEEATILINQNYTVESGTGINSQIFKFSPEPPYLSEPLAFQDFTYGGSIYFGKNGSVYMIGSPCSPGMTGNTSAIEEWNFSIEDPKIQLAANSSFTSPEEFVVNTDNQVFIHTRADYSVTEGDLFFRHGLFRAEGLNADISTWHSLYVPHYDQVYPCALVIDASNYLYAVARRFGESAYLLRSLEPTTTNLAPVLEGEADPISIEQGFLTVKNAEAGKELKIYDATGNLLYRGAAIAGCYLPSLAESFYLICIERSTGIETVKLYRH